jgi:predicted RNA binding protein YcfA (HicA-like mRNA interferase family)
MKEFEKLLQQAKDSPNNLRFGDLCKLAELFGFIKSRQRGSHILYSHPQITDVRQSVISFQEGSSGKAKPYQVKQLLSKIEEYNMRPSVKRS